MKDNFDILGVVPGFVAYPHLEDPFDVIDNQDKYLLHHSSNELSISSDSEFPARLEVNNYYSQFCKFVPFIHGSVDINVQMFNSYNQQLFVSIFNIINSYNNQNDTIWNNINYLKYFYHLFPIHVNKFYWLFHKFVNPKIEELKKSIKYLEDQKNSITSEITNLGGTNEKIKNLSGQIGTNVEEFNKTIEDHERFDSLASTIKSHINRELQKIQGMDKTTDITQELDKIVQEIKHEAEQKLQVVQSAFDRHKRVIKINIWKYVRAIEKSLTAQISNKIPHLVEEIEKLVGKNGVEKGGKLSSIAEVIKKFRSEHPNEYKYLEIAHIVNIRDIREIYRLTPEWKDKQKITDIDRTLKEILKELQIYLQKIKDIRDKMRNYNYTNIEKYRNNLQADIDKINLFNTIVIQNKNYKIQLGEAIRLLGDLKILKGLFGRYKANFIQSFRKGVEVMTSVEYEELIRIYHAIDGVRKKTDRIRRQLNNIVSIFGYLDVVKRQKQTIEVISFDSDGLAAIHLLIKTMSRFISDYQSAVNSIIGSSSILIIELKKVESLSSQTRNERSKILLGTVGLDKITLDLLKGWNVKLKAIKSFNNTLTQIKNGMRQLNGNSKQSNGSDVENVLKWLEGIDKTLATAYKSTNPAVTGMKTNYDQKKDQINGTKNGKSIEEHVDKIKEIPDKIAELHSKVKYYTVLLDIEKSVNETFDSVKNYVWNLEYIKFPLGYLKKNVERIIERYEYIRWIIRCLGCLMCSISLVRMKGHEYI